MIKSEEAPVKFVCKSVKIHLSSFTQNSSRQRNSLISISPNQRAELLLYFRQGDIQRRRFDSLCFVLGKILLLFSSFSFALLT